MSSTAFTVLVPVLFVVLLGYAAGRAKAFDIDQVAGINELALDFALPASLFVGIVTIPRTQLTQDVLFILVALAALLGIYLLAFAVAMRVLRLSPSAAALFALGAAFPSAPFFGPAVLGGLFGQSSALAIASTAIIANLLLLPITVVVLEVARRARRHNHERLPNPADKNEAKEEAMLTVVGNSVSYAFKRPYVWAPVVALALVLIGIQVPSLINSMLNLIGETTSGVSLFVSGLLLAAYSLKLNGVVAINAAFKSIVQPALMLGLVGFVSIGNPLAGEAVVAAALPSAVIVPMLAGQYGTYQAEAGSTMVLTVALMMVVVPLFMLLAA
jgi:malonate transporter and related proteins